MLGREVVSGQIQQAFESKVNAENALRAAGLDVMLLRSAGPVNDDIPPSSITGLTATAIYNGVQLAWDSPPPEDYVRQAVVEITPDGGSPREEVFADDDSATVFGLDDDLHSFRVKLIDQWGLENAWSGIVSVVPISAAVTDIDLAFKQAQGTLQGLIEAINLAGPTAEQGIQGVALAATYANNMLPLIESDMEMWNNSAAWPPASAVNAQGFPIISSDEPIGHTLSMARHEGNWKIKHDRATPSTNYAWYVTQWREERRVTAGEYYIAQATVTGPSGATVSIALENADDAAGLNMTTANEAQVTLGGGTQKIYVGMVAGSKPYVRLRLGLHTDSTTVWWHKFMLERARALTNEPSPWNAGILAVGSVAAHTLTAITANVAQAVIADAAIQDAKIGSVKADKIITGELVSNIIISNGKIQGAGATIDQQGIYLSNQETNPDGPSGTGANGYPSGSTVGDWLTSNPASSGLPRPHSGIGFFDDTNDPRRGILIRSRGVTDGNKDGFISIGATSGGTDLSANTAAYINIRAARPGLTGAVSIGHKLVVNGEMSLPNRSIKSDDIDGLDVAKLNGGGAGHNVGPDLLPEISQIRGRLSYGELANTPDLGAYVKDAELNQKIRNLNFTTSNDVERIVRRMVKASALG